jgi:acyl carrier protein
MSTIDNVTEILEEFCPGVDLDSCTTLIDDHILGSLTMVALVAELEDSFDIEIPPVEIVASNFNSAAAISALVERLSDEYDD